MKSETKGVAAAKAAKAAGTEKTAVKKTSAKTAEKKAPAEKTTEKKTPAEKTTEKKAPVEKATEKKAPARKSAVKEAVYLQYLGKEINKDELMNQVRTIWTKDLKRKVSELKSVTLYLKPEENAAYYVINEETTGKIAL